MRQLSTRIRHAHATVPMLVLLVGLALAAGLFLLANRQAGTADTANMVTMSVTNDRAVVLALQDERSAVAKGAGVSDGQRAALAAATDAVAPTGDADFLMGLSDARQATELGPQVQRYNNLILGWLDRSVATDPSLIENAEARQLLVAGGSLIALRESFAVEVATVSTTSASELIDAQMLTDGWIDAVQLAAPSSIFADLQPLLSTAAMDELRDAERAALTGGEAEAKVLDTILTDRLTATAGVVRTTSTTAEQIVADAAAVAERNRVLQPALALTTTLVIVALWLLLHWRNARSDTTFGDEALEIARNDFPDLLASVEAGEVDEAMVFPVEAPPQLESAAEAMAMFQEVAVSQALVSVADKANTAHAVATAAGRARHLIGEQRATLRDLELGDRPIGEADAMAHLHHLIERLAATNEQLLVLSGANGLPVPVIGTAAVSAIMFAATKSSREPARVIVDVADDATISTELGQDLVTIIRELVDNALAYSAPSLDVLVTGHVHDGGFLLWVCDEGIGLDATTLAELNAELDRSCDLGSTGPDGLGLAVVSELAQRHDLQVSLLTDAATGVQARVQLPAHQVASLGFPRGLANKTPTPAPSVAPVVETPVVETPVPVTAAFVSPEPFDDRAMRSSSASLSHRLLASMEPSDEGGSLVVPTLASLPEDLAGEPHGFGTDR